MQPFATGAAVDVGAEVHDRPPQVRGRIAHRLGPREADEGVVDDVFGRCRRTGQQVREPQQPRTAPAIELLEAVGSLDSLGRAYARLLRYNPDMPSRHHSSRFGSTLFWPTTNCLHQDAFLSVEVLAVRGRRGDRAGSCGQEQLGNMECDCRVPPVETPHRLLESVAAWANAGPHMSLVGAQPVDRVARARYDRAYGLRPRRDVKQRRADIAYP